MISPIGSTGFQFPAAVYNPALAGKNTTTAVSAAAVPANGVETSAASSSPVAAFSASLADTSSVSATFSASRSFQSMNGTLNDSGMAALALLALRDNDEEGGLSPAQKFFLMMLVLGLFNNNFNAGYQSGSLDYTLNVAGGLPLAYTSAAGIIGDILTPGLFVNTVV